MGKPVIDITDFEHQWLSAEPWIVARTSGSTGEPKEIHLSKSDMRLSAESTCRFFGLNSGSRLALVLSDDYIAGKMMRVRREVCGGSLYVETPSSHPLRNCHSTECFDLVAVVPTQLAGLMEAKCSIRFVLVGGAPVSPAQEAAMSEFSRLHGTRFYATYGMTETCSHVALRPVGSDRYIPLPGHRFGLTSDNCLTIEHDIASWSPVITRDTVELYPDNSFVWLGRADNIINSGGIKIHPEQVEKLIGPLSGGELFYIAGRPSPIFGSEAVLVAERGTRPDAELTGELNSRIGTLPRYHRPREIILIDSAARTPNGKLRRIIPKI